jgi:hypothetical protein
MKPRRSGILPIGSFLQAAEHRFYNVNPVWQVFLLIVMIRENPSSEVPFAPAGVIR